MCELTSGSAEHWPRLMASQAQDINVTNPHSLIIKAAGFRYHTSRRGSGWGWVQWIWTHEPAANDTPADRAAVSACLCCLVSISYRICVLLHFLLNFKQIINLYIN